MVNFLKKKVGLRTEILVTLTLLLGAALLLGGVMMLRFTERTLLKERVRQLDSLSRVLGQSLVNDMSGDSSFSVQNVNRSLLDQLPENLNCDGWWVFDRDLNLINSYSTGSVTPFSFSQRQQVKFSGELYRSINFPNFLDDFQPSANFLVPLMDNIRFIGLLELNYSLADVRLNLVKSQQIIIVYVFLYGLVLVAAGYYLLQRNIILPAQQLLRATENVGQGNLDTRLPVSGPLEISQLAIAYNQMVEALQTSSHQTNIYILELEKKNGELQKIRMELLRSEKLASIGQMGAGLAHEIGNPLAALIGYLELLKSHLDCTESKDIVKRSLIEAERIDYLVRDLLDFASPAKNSDVLIDAAKVMIETVELLKLQGVFNDISVNLALPPELPLVKNNYHRLQQVCVNLLLNAIQASTESGTIHLSAGVNDRQIWISVKDEGSGISDRDIGQLFDPFFTTKKSGRGLGLSICHRIIEDFGGTITVQSVLGQGSLFTVHLPIAEK